MDTALASVLVCLSQYLDTAAYICGTGSLTVTKAVGDIGYDKLLLGPRCDVLVPDISMPMLHSPAKSYGGEGQAYIHVEVRFKEESVCRSTAWERLKNLVSKLLILMVFYKG